MIETKVDNWTYRVTDDKDLEVVPPKDCRKAVPKTLFKYYSLSDYSMQVLENLEIFASHPKILNDPFDTHDSLIAFDDKDAIRTLFGSTLDEPEIKQAFENDIESLKGFAQYNFRTLLYGKLGIYSMTEKPTNLLMWSYYTGHKGFCIEFDHTKFPFKFHGPFQINYSRDFAPLSIKNGGHICMLYQSILKAKDWEHEQEWRILPEREGAKPMELRELDALKDLPDVTNRNFSITKNSIVKIIIGHQFFDSDNEFTHFEEGLKVNLKSNVDFKNRFLNVVDKLNIPMEIIFRNEPHFGFRTEPILIERVNRKLLIIKKNVT